MWARQGVGERESERGVESIPASQRFRCLGGSARVWDSWSTPVPCRINIQTLYIFIYERVQYAYSKQSERHMVVTVVKITFFNKTLFVLIRKVCEKHKALILWMFLTSKHASLVVH